MQHGFGESEISWTTTGKANIILDNLIEMGKITPFGTGKGRLRRTIKPCFAGTYAGRGNYSDGREKISVWRSEENLMSRPIWRRWTIRTLITIFIPFSGASEIMTVSVPDFWKRMQSSRRKVSMKSGKSIRADMTGMCGDRALRILRRWFSGRIV